MMLHAMQEEFQLTCRGDEAQHNGSCTGARDRELEGSESGLRTKRNVKEIFSYFELVKCKSNAQSHSDNS